MLSIVFTATALLPLHIGDTHFVGLTPPHILYNGIITTYSFMVGGNAPDLPLDWYHEA